MRHQKAVPGILSLLAVLFLGFNSAPVRAQGGTGKLPPPPPRMPPIRKMPPPRRDPPTVRQSSTCSVKSPSKATGRTHTVNLSGGVKLDLVELPSGSFCM